MIGYKLSAFNFVLLFRKFPIVSVENILYLVQDGFCPSYSVWLLIPLLQSGQLEL
jgi:hypothetical protein